MFEGERIAGLSKTQTYVTPDDDEKKANSADQDSYVLARLLNKSGMLGFFPLKDSNALRRFAAMHECSPDA